MRIKQITFTGAIAELGEFVGVVLKDVIHFAVQNYSLLHDVLLPYHQSEAGQRAFQRMLAIHDKTFPEYMRELRGIAAGAEVEFELLFLMNLRGAYRGFSSRFDDAGCSSVAHSDDTSSFFIHNEDAVPAFGDTAYLLHCQPSNSHSFFVYLYPGFIPGNAFGFNEFGICWSINNVVPQNVTEGFGRHFIGRRLLDARNFEEAVANAASKEHAAGFHYVLGSSETKQITVVESAPGVSMTRAIEAPYFHSNHYVLLREQPQTIHPSSQCRYEVGKSLVQKRRSISVEDGLSILRDTSHAEYPIYRTANPPDQCLTTCTAVMNLTERACAIYLAGNISNAPDLTLSL